MIGKKLRFFLWFFSLLTTACTKSSEKLVFITCCVDGKFFIPVKKGMNDAASLLGVSVEFRGTEGVDLLRQAEMIREAVDEGVSGIAVNLIDPSAFDDAVAYAREKNIPVVAFNVDDSDTQNGRLSAINQNFVEAGKSLGNHLLSQFQEFGIQSDEEILFTMHDVGVSALEQRLEGVSLAFGLKESSVNPFITGNDSVVGGTKLLRYLEEHPNIKLIVSSGQSDAEASGRAIELLDRVDKPAAAGFDLSDKTVQLIEDGCLVCTVDQQPYIQGYFPVLQLTLLIRYGLIPISIDTGAAIIQKKDLKLLKKMTQAGYR